MTATNMCSNFCGFSASPPLSLGIQNIFRPYTHPVIAPYWEVLNIRLYSVG